MYCKEPKYYRFFLEANCGTVRISKNTLHIHNVNQLFKIVTKKVNGRDTSFFSPSGNYKIDLQTVYINNQGEMFLVKANPNGNYFSKEGSAVIGCYNPLSGNSFVKEFSSKTGDKGEKPYQTCGVETRIARGPPPIKGCTDPDALNYNPDATLDNGSCRSLLKGCTVPEALDCNPEPSGD